MFVIIDMEHLKMVAAAHKRRHMELILEVDFADVHCMICSAHDGTSWTAFSHEQMDTLYKNTSGLTEVPPYGEAIEQLRAYVLTWSDYHKSEEELEAELRQLIDDGEIPEDDPVQQQINANKMMRKAHQDIINGVERANAKAAADPQKQAAKQIEAKPAKPAKPVNAPTQGLTKRVWEIGDAVKAANPTAALKEVRKKIMELCDEEGLNPGTAATQYGRWKTERGYA